MGYFKTWGTPLMYLLVYYYIVLFVGQVSETFHLLSCEGHGARMKFCQETWQGESLVFALLTLEVHPRKT